jgi:hypothetical protein
MSLFTMPRLSAVQHRHPGVAEIRVFVESGTFHGKTTRMAAARFAIVHTIELHEAWYQEAVRELGPLGVHCHHGDSATVVPQLAAEIQEPVVWYLDAHYFTLVPDVAGADVPLPLWAELAAIARRRYPDVIVVDDVRSFGTENPTPEWAEVSLDRIAAAFPGHREAVILHDQAVVYR